MILKLIIDFKLLFFMDFSSIRKVFAGAGFLVLLGLQAQAQGLYTKLGGGYNVGIGGGNGQNHTYTRTGNPQAGIQATEEVEWVQINLGQGLTGSGAVGFMFSEQVGAELELSYLHGGDNEVTQKNINEDPTFGSASTFNSNLYSRLWLLQPSVVLNADFSEKVDLYGKFGISLSKGHIIAVSNMDAGQDTYTETKYDGGFGFGFQAALGLAVNISEKTGIYTEIKMNNLSYAPTDYHLVKKTINGEDKTDTETRDIPMEESFTNINGQREVYLKSAFPYSFVGFNLGLRYSF